MFEYEFVRAIAVLVILQYVVGNPYNVSPVRGVGREFDGIGAISGGGATSKLLLNYPAKQQNEILDYLFKPQFGASLDILKVEIGGDAQSSEGTESSHMHVPWEENYARGYEWWMMKEAKKRNPNIKLYGLPWGWPGWIGGDNWWPYFEPQKPADYITKWILGAKKYHNLTIDYIGLWNEKPFDINYVKVLRKTLNLNGLKSVKIVAADMIGTPSWEIATAMKQDPELASIVDIIGGHYITAVTDDALDSKKPLWSSEDYSYPNNEIGGGCMAHLLNINYLYGSMTGFIAWNMLVAYYPGLDYNGHGLMTAQHPWSGHYEVNSPIWTAAHTTQFTEIGWRYLEKGSGSGFLAKGGTYVSFIGPDNQYTLVIETMNTTSNHGFCSRPPELGKITYEQSATFNLKDKLIEVKELHLWQTKLGLGRDDTQLFKYGGKVQLKNGSVSLHLEVNSVYTLTTVASGKKGLHPPPPPAKPFPTNYFDDFQRYPIHSEAFNFAQQTGVYEVHRDYKNASNKVMRQVLIERPVHWCPFPMVQTLNVIGDSNWSDVSISVDVLVPSINGTERVYVAARVDNNGCQTLLAQGVFLMLSYKDQAFYITKSIAGGVPVGSGPVTLKPDVWYRLKFAVKGQHVTVSLNGKTLYDADAPKLDMNKKGFPAVGTFTYGLADFDNFSLKAL